MDIGSLDWRLLQAFQLVARHGSLKQAAARLNQTVPAVSIKIKRLEEGLGVQLFERLPNRMVLTRTGLGFLEEVDLLFGQAEHALSFLSQKASIRGRLSVSIGSDHSWFFVPRISKFLMRYPEVELSLQVYHAADALDALARGDLDVCTGIFPNIPKTLEERIIMRTSLCLLCREDDPLLERTPPRLSELAYRRLILLPRHAETRHLTERVLEGAGVKVDTVIEVANCQTAGMLVREGVGVGILHTRCVEHFTAEGTRWSSLDKALAQVSFSAVYRPRDINFPLVRTFLAQMTSDSGRAPE